MLIVFATSTSPATSPLSGLDNNGFPAFLDKNDRRSDKAKQGRTYQKLR